MDKLDGKIALISSGDSGIETEAAKQFVSGGARVFITSRRKGELAAAVVQISRNVTLVEGDVSKVVDLDRLIAASVSKPPQSCY
jgi:NAD(P)-dependent dehydrogenase (short-subunit alcohol dehydrogenase family)